MALTKTDTTNASSFYGTVISRMTEDARENNLGFLNLFNRDREKELTKGNDRVSVLGVNDFTVASALSAGGTLTHEAGAFATAVSVIVDTHATKSFDLEHELRVLSAIDLMEKLAGKAGYSVALKMDDDAAGMVDDFGTNLVGSLTIPYGDEEILSGKQKLDTALVPEEGRVHVFHGTQGIEFYKVDKYVNALYKNAIGGVDTKSGKYRGYIGSLYGMDWYSLSNTEGTDAAGHDNGMWHKSAVDALVLEEARVAEMYEIDTDSHKYAVHSLYGLKEVRDDHGVWMKGA